MFKSGNERFVCVKEGVLMEKANQIEFKVYGKYALFSDPITRVGSEKSSYMIPTYEALKGVCKSIYFKPTFEWYVDEVRIMKPIQTQSKGVRPIQMNGGNSLSYYTYLCDVEYQVKAHFEWNMHHEELAQDRNENKHYFIAKRMLERGGRRDIFLGTRECQGYVEPCVFGDGKGFYDEINEMQFGIMEHGIIYPDQYVREEEAGKLVATFWNPLMRKGVINFIRPEECTYHRVIGSGVVVRFDNDNFSGLKEFETGGDSIELDK